MAGDQIRADSNMRRTLLALIACAVTTSAQAYTTPLDTCVDYGCDHTVRVYLSTLNLEQIKNLFKDVTKVSWYFFLLKSYRFV